MLLNIWSSLFLAWFAYFICSAGNTLLDVLLHSYLMY